MGHWDSNPNDVMSFYDGLNAYGAWDKNRMAQQGKDPCCFVTGMTTTLCFTKLRALRNMKNIGGKTDNSLQIFNNYRSSIIFVDYGTFGLIVFY